MYSTHPGSKLVKLIKMKKPFKLPKERHLFFHPDLGKTYKVPLETGKWVESNFLSTKKDCPKASKRGMKYLGEMKKDYEFK